MHKTLSALTLVAGLTLPPAVEAQTETPAPQKETAKATLVAVPKEVENFNGMLVGRMVSRDVERGEFVVTIDYVPRIWENNKAKNPRALVGKTVGVEGVTGKFLDSLLLIRPGETVEFEAQHRGGERLRFPGEWLHKVPPFDPKNYPSPPEDFRGFVGQVVGKIESKTDESGELVLRISEIVKSAPNNRAEKTESVVGKSILVVGFYGKMRKPFDELKVGDTVQTGLLHRVTQSDHFNVTDGIEKTDGKSTAPRREKDDAPREEARRDTPKKPDDGKFPEGMQGFRGILLGDVVSRDTEKGELVFRAEKVTRTWKQNKATDLESCQGRTLTVRGISGNFLDVLLVLKPGDRIEVEAFHNRGEQFEFPGEMLKKVEPSK